MFAFNFTDKINVQKFTLLSAQSIYRERLDLVLRQYVTYFDTNINFGYQSDAGHALEQNAKK